MQNTPTADPTKMTEEELYRLNIYHEADDGHSEKQLHSLYGLVNEDQDREIISAVHGKKVLDVGAGYGTLSRRLKDAGFEVTAIEPNPHTPALGWCGCRAGRHREHGWPAAPRICGAFEEGPPGLN